MAQRAGTSSGNGETRGAQGGCGEEGRCREEAEAREEGGTQAGREERAETPGTRGGRAAQGTLKRVSGDTGAATTQVSAAPAVPLVHNRTFDEIAVGDSAAIERTLRAEDIQLFAALSGDDNPQHLDATFAARSRFHGVIAHGMWSATLISAVLGTRLPGAGTIYLGQTLRFIAPVRVGDTLTVSLVVRERDERTRQLVLDCRAVDQDGRTVVEGEARVVAPDEKVSRPAAMLPQVRVEAGHPGAQRLLDHVRPLGAIRVAFVQPCNAVSLSSALEARAAGLVEPILVGPRARIEAIAAEHAIDLAGARIEDTAHSHAAAARAAELAVASEVEAIAKGSLHTDELMGALLPSAAGLRTKRRVSHCFLMQTPAYPRPFIITDAAINIAPTLEEKADIIRNAIDLAHAIGVSAPRVAILAAVETVNPRMPATLDAAALCKMADRGQIDGGVLDGPLAFDNAVSIAAARIKGITSPVAGMADILVVPDLESGNMLAKQLEYLGDAESAGIVLGLRVPVVLTSRADPADSRIASCALAVLLAHRYRTKPP
ncbi:MAG: bifunctional enoyl-CoA hydratase/phosphate acetyltransferase [Xanthomonadales bacterium]|nr:bifunctional enoyl-CoA hydratase/phosphate acetyltransferase [Xanthomonadales bacterium]